MDILGHDFYEAFFVEISYYIGTLRQPSAAIKCDNFLGKKRLSTKTSNQMQERLLKQCK